MAELTEAEAAVYDRQLRVWGVEVQKRLRNARVLIVGCGGLAAEVAKNIVLAGVGRLELLDHTPSSQAAPSNFLNVPVHDSESVSQVMARGLSEMNPMVQVTSSSEQPEPTEALVQGFNLVLVIGKPLGSLLAWNELCRQHGIAFLAAVSRGTQAFFFLDAGQHKFQPPDKEGKAQAVIDKAYVSLQEALQSSWTSKAKLHSLVPVILLTSEEEGGSHEFLIHGEMEKVVAKANQMQTGKKTKLSLETLEEYLISGEELAPVNAIVGGVLANEVLKCISKKGQPIDNLFCYSMLDGNGIIERLAP